MSSAAEDVEAGKREEADPPPTYWTRCKKGLCAARDLALCVVDPEDDCEWCALPEDERVAAAAAEKDGVLTVEEEASVRAAFVREKEHKRPAAADAEASS